MRCLHKALYGGTVRAKNISWELGTIAACVGEEDCGVIWSGNKNIKRHPSARGFQFHFTLSLVHSVLLPNKGIPTKPLMTSMFGEIRVILPR